MSTFTPLAVCLRSNVSPVFPIWQPRLLSFGTERSCQCKSGRTLEPIDTDVRKDSLSLPPPGLINDRSLLLQRGSRCVGEGGSCHELQMWNYWLACRANSKTYYSTFGNMWQLHNRVKLHNEYSLKMANHWLKTLRRQKKRCLLSSGLVCNVLLCSAARPCTLWKAPSCEIYCHYFFYCCVQTPKPKSLWFFFTVILCVNLCLHFKR